MRGENIIEQTGQGYGLLDLQRQKGGHYIGKASGEPTASQLPKYRHTHQSAQMARAKGAYVREGGMVVDAKTGQVIKS